MVKKMQIIALCLMGMFLIHTISFSTTLIIQSVFAQSDTYSIENVIYLNVTAIGVKSTEFEIKKLVIKEPMRDITENTKLSTKAIEGNEFTPNATNQFLYIKNSVEYETLQTINFVDSYFDLSKAEMGIVNTYKNGSALGENLSTFYENFQRTPYTYPTVTKQIIFDSPYHYAVKYCEENDYTLHNIVNSTYNEEYDVSTINTFQSQLLQTTYFITENVTKVQEMETEFLGLIIGLIILLWFVCPMITDIVCNWMQIEAKKQIAINQIWADMNVTVAAINGETNITIALVEAKAANEQMILDMYNNGSISFEQAMALLQKVGGDYSALISQRELNIVDITNDYYNHSETMMDKYFNGLGIETSWTDVFMYLIILIAVGFACYAVYALLLRKDKSPASTVVVMGK